MSYITVDTKKNQENGQNYDLSDTKNSRKVMMCECSIYNNVICIGDVMYILVVYV